MYLRRAFGAQRCLSFCGLIAAWELVERSRAWGEAAGHRVVVVWEGGETADDRIAREVTELEPPVWVVTSDRELRERVAPHVERILGGGSFARELRSAY